MCLLLHWGYCKCHCRTLEYLTQQHPNDIFLHGLVNNIYLINDCCSKHSLWVFEKNICSDFKSFHSFFIPILFFYFVSSRAFIRVIRVLKYTGHLNAQFSAIEAKFDVFKYICYYLQISVLKMRALEKRAR